MSETHISISPRLINSLFSEVWPILTLDKFYRSIPFPYITLNRLQIRIPVSHTNDTKRKVRRSAHLPYANVILAKTIVAYFPESFATLT